MLVRLFPCRMTYIQNQKGHVIFKISLAEKWWRCNFSSGSVQVSAMKVSRTVLNVGRTGIITRRKKHLCQEKSILIKIKWIKFFCIQECCQSTISVPIRHSITQENIRGSVLAAKIADQSDLAKVWVGCTFYRRKFKYFSAKNPIPNLDC